MSLYKISNPVVQFIRVLLIVFLYLGSCAVHAQTVENPIVIMFVPDGLHADAISVLGPSGAPNFWRMRTEGAFTDNARAEYNRTNTTPGFSTIVTSRPIFGVSGHLWSDNSDDPLLLAPSLHHPHSFNPVKTEYAYVPSVFDVVHDNGLRTSMHYIKTRLDLVAQSYTTHGGPDLVGQNNGTNKIDVLYKSASGEQSIVTTWLANMNANPFRYSFLPFQSPDGIAHTWTWDLTPGSRYLQAVQQVDGYLGMVFDLIESDPRFVGRTYILMTTDHGGVPGTDSHQDFTNINNYRIPFYVWGPGVEAGADLYQLNPGYADPGTSRPDYSDPDNQPIRNGDISNLSVQLLDLPPIPGSTMNADHRFRINYEVPGLSELTINDVTVSEGDGQASFTISLSPASSNTVTVQVATANGTAIAPGDYASTPLTTRTFSPGQTTKTVVVPIVDDSLTEGTELFTVNLSNASNALITKSSGTGTILDNEVSACGEPSFDKATEAAVFIWQDCANQTWNIRVTAGGIVSTYVGSIDATQAFDSVVPYLLETNDVLDFTSDPTRIDFGLQVGGAGQDGFSFSMPIGGTACFTLDSPALPVYLGADRVAMPNTFDLATQGSCSVNLPGLTINDVTASEGDGQANFTVTLNPASSQTVTVQVNSANGTAVAPDDFAAVSMMLTFSPGQTGKVVPVLLVDDPLAEGTEAFTMNLSNASNAVISRATGSGVIVDNENTTCGQPSFNKATESAVFIWQDCPSGTWNVRVTAGGQNLTYTGNVVSSQMISSIVPYLLEGNDVLNVSIPGRIDYSLIVGSAGQDGYSFTVQAGASSCFTLNSPGLPILLGSGRISMTSSFDLSTLGACP